MSEFCDERFRNEALHTGIDLVAQRMEDDEVIESLERVEDVENQANWVEWLEDAFDVDWGAGKCTKTTDSCTRMPV